MVVTTTFGRRLMSAIKYNDWTHLSKTKNPGMTDTIINSVALVTGVGTGIGLSYCMSGKNDSLHPFLFRSSISAIGGLWIGSLTHLIVSSPIALLIVGGATIPVAIGEKMRKWF